MCIRNGQKYSRFWRKFALSKIHTCRSKASKRFLSKLGQFMVPWKSSQFSTWHDYDDDCDDGVDNAVAHICFFSLSFSLLSLFFSFFYFFFFLFSSSSFSKRLPTVGRNSIPRELLVRYFSPAKTRLYVSSRVFWSKLASTM